MTIPTTPGKLGRVRARITKTLASNERPIRRRVARRSLLAALSATTAVALTGALAAPGAQAAAHPDVLTDDLSALLLHHVPGLDSGEERWTP